MTVNDPEYNALARIGEIKSRVNLALDEATKIVSDLSEKRQEKVVLRGVLDVRSVSGSFIASFQNVAPVEISGITIPPRPGSYVRGVGTDVCEAIKALATEMKQNEVMG